MVQTEKERGGIKRSEYSERKIAHRVCVARLGEVICGKEKVHVKDINSQLVKGKFQKFPGNAEERFDGNEEKEVLPEVVREEIGPRIFFHDPHDDGDFKDRAREMHKGVITEKSSVAAEISKALGVLHKSQSISQNEFKGDERGGNRNNPLFNRGQFR